LHALDESFVTAQKEEVAHLVEQLERDPAATLRALRDRSQGLYWCMEQCMQLEEYLQTWVTLEPTEWVRVINLMGKRISDWLIDQEAARFTRAFLASYYGDAPLDLEKLCDMVHTARPERMSPCEYSHHMGRLTENLEGKVEGNAAMRATLVAMVEEMAQHLDWIEYREARDRSLALKKARVDASAEGTKLTSYTLRHNGARNTALRRLEVIQKLRLEQEARDTREQPERSNHKPTVEPTGHCADPVEPAGNAGEGWVPDAVGRVDHKLTDEPERLCTDEAGRAEGAGEDRGPEPVRAVNPKLTDEPERHCTDEAGCAGPSPRPEGNGVGQEDQGAARADFPPDSLPPTPHAGAAGGPKSGRTLKDLVGEEEARAIEEAARQRMEQLLIAMEMEANGQVDSQAVAEGMARWQTAMEAARAGNQRPPDTEGRGVIKRIIPTGVIGLFLLLATLATAGALARSAEHGVRQGEGFGALRAASPARDSPPFPAQTPGSPSGMWEVIRHQLE
jgi:hypothetical protein